VMLKFFKITNTLGQDLKNITIVVMGANFIITTQAVLFVNFFLY
jgi:hypothetical protein